MFLITRLGITITIALWLGAICQAQSISDLTYQYLPGGQNSGITVSPSGTISFPSAPVGTASVVTFVIQNQGPANWNLAQVNTTGSAFTLSGLAPATIPAHSSVSMALTFNAAAAGLNTGTLSLTVSAGIIPPTAEIFFLSGTATAPSFVLSYILNPGGNQTAIASGQTITLAPVNVGATSTATFVIANQGNAAGTVNSIGVSGPPFLVSGLPLLPATIPPQANFNFTITFQPTAAGPASGTLALSLGGSSVTIRLAGQAAAPLLTYDVTSGSAKTTITPGQTVLIPSAQVGQTSSVSITVSNTGDAPAQVNSISVTGAGAVLSITGASPLPVSLAPQQSTTFQVQFAPVTSGPVTGQLLINTASFPVSATGLGPRLSLSTQIAGIVTQIPANGTINFPNTTVGAQVGATVSITNSGNQALTVSNIAVTGPDADDFTGGGYPALPLVLQPGASASFSVVFEPDAVGVFNGVLQIAGQTFNLFGSGNAPPLIPGVQFGTAPSQANPAQQASISLSLTQTYPYDLTGQLVVSFSSSAFVDDPAIQFATGGRTAAFTIPANSTQAIFGTSATSIPFQTGTVAGTITFTPSFLVRGVNVTPSPAPANRVQVQSTPPLLQSIRVASPSATGFNLLITGFAPMRQMSTIQLQFTPATGATLETTSLTVDVSSQFGTWYQSTASQQFGSQYTVTLSILVRGNFSDVKSVTATAINSQGTSAPVSVNLQ